MLLGEYELKIDHKGRLAIPVRFRGAFQNGLVLSRSFDRCLIAYTMTEWKKVADRLVSLPLTRLNTRRIARFTFSGAFALEPDRQGRIILPPVLREYAGIDDRVVVVGAYTHVQLWSAEQWAAEKEYMSKHASEIAEAVEM